MPGILITLISAVFLEIGLCLPDGYSNGSHRNGNGAHLNGNVNGAFANGKGNGNGNRAFANVNGNIISGKLNSNGNEIFNHVHGNSGVKNGNGNAGNGASTNGNRNAFSGISLFANGNGHGALSDSIPGGGVPGQDYPILASVPEIGFTCDTLIPGYYADTDPISACQVFHICQDDGRQDSFLCPNGTLFNQQYLVCDWWFNVDCVSSQQFYFLNAEIRKVNRVITNGNGGSNTNAIRAGNGFVSGDGNVFVSDDGNTNGNGNRYANRNGVISDNGNGHTNGKRNESDNGYKNGNRNTIGDGNRRTNGYVNVKRNAHETESYSSYVSYRGPNAFILSAKHQQ